MDTTEILDLIRIILAVGQVLLLIIYGVRRYNYEDTHGVLIAFIYLTLMAISVSHIEAVVLN